MKTISKTLAGDKADSHSRYLEVMIKELRIGLQITSPRAEGAVHFSDYFRQAFEHNRGIRIDHFLLSPNLTDRLMDCEIDMGPRGQTKPSDHTAIIITPG